jgi:ABC-2 type transport system permease protein
VISTDAEGILATIKSPHRKSGSWFGQAWGVFWANAKVLFSYRTWLATELLGMPISVAIYFFTSMLVVKPSLADAGYGTDYLSFALIGVSMTNFVWVTIVRLSHTIQHEVEDGTLEVVLSSPTRMSAYLVGQSLRGLLLGGIFFVATMFVGVTFFGASLRTDTLTLLSAATLILFTLFANLGIGVVAAAVILVYKRGDPVVFIVSALTEFLSGVVYPLKLLQGFPVLQQISAVLPYTYGLEGVRHLLLKGAAPQTSAILYDFSVLLLYVLVLYPLAFYGFRMSFDRIRREGTTASY